jgi:cell division septal protein FtsQ
MISTSKERKDRKILRKIGWKFLMWCFGTAGIVWAYLIMGYLGIVSVFSPEYVDNFLDKLREEWENE